MPKTYHCWRCKRPVPMLTDSEWDEVRPLLHVNIPLIKQHSQQSGIAFQELYDQLRHRACEKYFEITGYKETNSNALWHHHLSDHGPECSQCGHLLRTPKASFCANCGARPEHNRPA